MRILIADDDATSRLLLKAVATKLGHECLVATDGSGAWELLTTEGFDVLLTDWMMPGMDGPELCRRVRQEMIDRYLYIVLVTALSNHDRVLEGMQAGADDYLIKPIDPFAVEARLVVAERVTTLHRQLVEVRAQLERSSAVATQRSLTDPLTGLGNRRRMEEDLASAHAHSLRAGGSFGVALFDIDHFKRYNDHYGHLAGDDVLRRVAQCFQDVVRADERVYRYGGEEFLLLVNDGTLEGVAAAAERVRTAVAAIAVEHAFRPAPPDIVTLSGGVACWSGAGESPAELLQSADDALFGAKSRGRNLVLVSSGDGLNQALLVPEAILR
jgi:two-component system chemotaxis response regulator CheY